jgi:type I restriction enzyme S subunit
VPVPVFSPERAAQVMTLDTFVEKFDLFADAPDAVARMRELVLHLAFSGKLLPTAASWPVKPLKSLAKKIGSGATPTGGKDSYFTEGIPLIRSMNVHFAGFEPKGLVFLSDDQASQLANATVQSADVLLNITGASIGRVTTVPPELAGARVNQHVAIVRPTKELNEQFLSKFLASPAIQRMIDDVQVGATREALTKRMIEQFQVPRPPLAEQKRIVAKVDELMALCDRLEAQQEERETRHAALARASLARFADAPSPANLNFLFHKSYPIAPADLRKSILTLAVHGKLVPQDSNDEPAEQLIYRIAQDRERIANDEGLRLPKPVPPVAAENCSHDIPASWQWARLGSLSILIDYGTSERAFNSPTKVPVYRMGNILGGKLNDQNLKYVEATIDGLPSLYLKSNDILFNRTNSYELVGKAAIFQGPDDTATFASYLIRIRLPTSHLFPAYFNASMNAPYFRQTQIEPEITQQCGQANFNGTKLASTLVPVPPLAEQRRIVAKVDQLMALVDALESELAASRTAAAKLMEAVVAELTALK